MHVNPQEEPTTTPKLLLPPNEAAEALAISPRKLWDLTNNGEVPCIHIGRAVRYAVDDLRQYIKDKKGGQQ